MVRTNCDNWHVLVCSQPAVLVSYKPECLCHFYDYSAIRSIERGPNFTPWIDKSVPVSTLAVRWRVFAIESCQHLADPVKQPYMTN